MQQTWAALLLSAGEICELCFGFGVVTGQTPPRPGRPLAVLGNQSGNEGAEPDHAGGGGQARHQRPQTGSCAMPPGHPARQLTAGMVYPRCTSSPGTGHWRATRAASLPSVHG